MYDRKTTNAGLLPPGIPGHSPELALNYDLALAQELLAEAGYPGGRGFPRLQGGYYYADIVRDEVIRQWRQGLGIQVDFDSFGEVFPKDLDNDKHLIFLAGYIADYPDPHNFFREASFLEFLRNRGWHDPTSDELVDRAAQTPDRALRMALYRDLDRRLVADQVLIIPLFHGRLGSPIYVQPWVKNFRNSALGHTDSRHIIIEPH